MARRPTHTSIEQHPQLDDLQAMLARVPQLTDAELRLLAGHWRNTAGVADARRAALSPDTLLVVDVLRIFDDIAALYSEDLDGETPWCTLEPAVVAVALKAVRDHVAAVYARPQLSRSAFSALSAPWRAAVSRGSSKATVTARPVPLASVVGLLDAVTGLAGRCHDLAQARTYDGLLVRAMTRDEQSRDDALAAAHDAAVLTGRRREWSLLRRDTLRTVAHRCGSCAVPAAALTSEYDHERVATLVADAACALLVSDVADAASLDALLAPLSGLVPLQRPTTEA